MTGGWLRRSLPIWASACAWLALPAAAQTEAAPRDEAARLFRDGRALLRQGQRAEACEKFRASLALERSPGLLLNVASCARDEGDLLRASADFEAAREEARRYPADDQRRELWLGAADEALRQLRPQLAEIQLVVPSGAALPSTWVAEVDGEPLVTRAGRALQSPGTHRLEVRAEGREPFTRELTLEAGERLQVEVQLALTAPATQALPAELAVTAPGEPSPERTSEAGPGSGQTLPVALAIGGGVLTLAGLGFGLLTWNRARELESSCPGPECSEDQLRDADRLATVADVLVGGGLALGAIGGIWWFIGQDREPSARVQAACFGGTACRAQLTLSF